MKCFREKSGFQLKVASTMPLIGSNQNNHKGRKRWEINTVHTQKRSQSQVIPKFCTSQTLAQDQTNYTERVLQMDLKQQQEYFYGIGREVRSHYSKSCRVWFCWLNEGDIK